MLQHGLKMYANLIVMPKCTNVLYVYCRQHLMLKIKFNIVILFLFTQVVTVIVIHYT